MVSARAALVLFSCVVLYSVQYVSATQCYACVSRLDGDCNTYPWQEKYKIDCGAGQLRDPGFVSRLTNNDYELARLLSTIGDQNTGGFNTRYQCLKVDGSLHGQRIVARSCVSSSSGCSYLRNPQYLNGVMTINNCTICEGDNCNSSTAIQAGFWSLILSLAVLFYAKH